MACDLTVAYCMNPDLMITRENSRFSLLSIFILEQTIKSYDFLEEKSYQSPSNPDRNFRNNIFL